MLLKFYDNKRRPYAYCEDHKTIYTYEGIPVAYIDTKDIYTFNGRHVGFYEDGNIWDHDGSVLLFTKDSLRGPLKPSKALMPLKRLKSKKPLKSKKWSTYNLSDVFPGQC